MVNDAIPQIVESLTGGDWRTRSAGIKAIGTLAEHRERSCLPWYLTGLRGLVLASFHDAIHGAVPQIVESLKDNDFIVKLAGATAVSNLARHRKRSRSP